MGLTHIWSRWTVSENHIFEKQENKIAKTWNSDTQQNITLFMVNIHTHDIDQSWLHLQNLNLMEWM